MQLCCRCWDLLQSNGVRVATSTTFVGAFLKLLPDGTPSVAAVATVLLLPTLFGGSRLLCLPLSPAPSLPHSLTSRECLQGMYLLALLGRRSKRAAEGPRPDPAENSFCARSALVCRHVVTIDTLLSRCAVVCPCRELGPLKLSFFELLSGSFQNLHAPLRPKLWKMPT